MQINNETKIQKFKYHKHQAASVKVETAQEIFIYLFLVPVHIYDLCITTVLLSPFKYHQGQLFLFKISNNINVKHTYKPWLDYY